MRPCCAMLDPSWARVGPKLEPTGRSSAQDGASYIEIGPQSLEPSRPAPFLSVLFFGRGWFSSRSDLHSPLLFSYALPFCLPIFYLIYSFLSLLLYVLPYMLHVFSSIFFPCSYHTLLSVLPYFLPMFFRFYALCFFLFFRWFLPCASTLADSGLLCK